MRNTFLSPFLFWLRAMTFLLSHRDAEEKRNTETNKIINMEINDITGEIIDASINVHSKLGPGLFESVYEEVLDYELKKEGFCPRDRLKYLFTTMN